MKRIHATPSKMRYPPFVQLERLSPVAFPALLAFTFACGSGGETGDAPRDGGSARDAGFALGGDAGVDRDGGPRDSGVERDGGVANGLCPPSDGTGTNVGDIFPAIALPDCAGNLHELQAPCHRKAAYYFVYAEW